MNLSKESSTRYNLDFREMNWALQKQEQDTYALGLTDTGQPVTHSILTTPPILISAENDLNTWALTKTILSTTKLARSHIVGIQGYVVSLRPQMWAHLHRTYLRISLQYLDQMLPDIPEHYSPGKVLMIFDNIGPDWNLPYQYLSWISKIPEVHLIASASPDYALKIQPLFKKIIIGQIVDSAKRNALIKPYKFDEHLAPGQFIFRQRGWRRFWTPRILKSEE